MTDTDPTAPTRTDPTSRLAVALAYLLEDAPTSLTGPIAVAEGFGCSADYSRCWFDVSASGRPVADYRVTVSRLPDEAEAEAEATGDTDLTAQLADVLAEAAEDHGYLAQAADILAWLDKRGRLATPATARDAADQDDLIQVGAEAVATPGTVLGYVVAIDDLDGRLLLDADGCFPASGMADAVEAAKESAEDDPRRRYFVAEIRDALADAEDLRRQPHCSDCPASATTTRPVEGVPAERADVPMMAMPQAEYEALQARLARLHQMLGLESGEWPCGVPAPGSPSTACLLPADHKGWHRNLWGAWTL